MRPDKRLAAAQRPSFAEALRFWFKLGWISFGGTAAHIAIMQDELVEKKRWISNRQLTYIHHVVYICVYEAHQYLLAGRPPKEAQSSLREDRGPC